MRKMARGAVALVVLCTAGGAAADTVPIGDATLEFGPGYGYCALDPAANDFDRDTVAWQSGLNEGRNLLLGMYLKCDRLRELRAGAEGGLGTFGLLLAPLADGKLEAVGTDDREEVVAQVAAFLGEQSGGMVEETQAAIDEALGRLAAAGGPAAAASSLEFVGVLRNDGDIVFFGLVANLDIAGEAQTMAGVMALTVAAGYVVTYNVYQPYVDPTTFDELVRLAATTRGMIVASDRGPRPETPAGDGRIVERTPSVVTIMYWVFGACIVVAVVGFALRRLRGRPPA